MLIFYDSSVVIVGLVFHSSFKQCCPLASSYVVGRVLSIGVQNSLSLTDTLPYLLCSSGPESLFL